MKEIEKERQILKSWTDKRITDLKNNFYKNSVRVNRAMFEVIKKQGDFKDCKEKFDKKYFFKNGEVFRRSDNAMLPWFNLNQIIYQKDLVSYFCFINEQKKEVTKNIWEVLNYWNDLKQN